ncbi:hypothetical protein TRFO_33551 [Tritrichomonas foetus]|uniref:Myb-like DNA-binding domain containing protein n=1 Tax=Tritrichomonas foetus TaxID=1144522 RepID=A0A1J4JQZ6_9EUKA|nr:hypothetical protein TRFO_33551 [Tritrichomonas foetus]|eukprot:OHS99941.1 hypothetical protein TRFO_33551 [Tritrichomonas foetus]
MSERTLDRDINNIDYNQSNDSNINQTTQNMQTDDDTDDEIDDNRNIQNDINCFDRNTKGQSRRFTALEDQKLQELVGQFGARRWRRIAQFIPGRTARQCRDRYCNYLSPDFYNDKWTHDEDVLLWAKYQELGSQWAKMTTFFPGKNANNIKNRWNYSVSRMKPQIESQNVQPNMSLNIQPSMHSNLSNGVQLFIAESPQQIQEPLKGTIQVPVHVPQMINVLPNPNQIPLNNIQHQNGIPITPLHQGNVQNIICNPPKQPIMYIPPEICSLRQSTYPKKADIDTRQYETKPRKLAPFPPIATLLAAAPGA